MSETSKIVEVNGIKMEIDYRTASIKKVEAYRVGDPIKLLLKEYSAFSVKPGVIVGFEAFSKRPTIIIAYLDFSEMKFANIFEGCEHEIVPASESDFDLNKDYLLDKMQREIDKKEVEIKDMKAKKEFFIKTFGQYLKETDSGNVVYV